MSSILHPNRDGEPHPQKGWIGSQSMVEKMVGSETTISSVGKEDLTGSNSDVYVAQYEVNNTGISL